MRLFIGSLALILATGAAAQSTPQDMAAIKARCAQYAHEDQVPDKELPAYMQDCINALSSEPESDDKSGTAQPQPSPQD